MELFDVSTGGSTFRPMAPTALPEKTTNSGFVLDAERIAKLQSETQKVSALLAGVFVEETSIDPEPLQDVQREMEPPTHGHKLLGLDSEHSAFLRKLLSQPVWSRADLHDIASDMELMLDGALERINEIALDLFDTQIAEGDDTIEINQEILEKIPA